MLSLPPTPLPPLAPLSQRQTTPSPFRQMNLLKQAMNLQTPPPDTPLYHGSIKRPEKPLLKPHRRTDPKVWLAAVFCLVFTLLLIFFGITSLIVFLVIKPRIPVFDTPNASLNVIYFDTPENFNGDFTVLTNFSNPNKKLDVRFELAEIELYFSDKLIATQALSPFSQRRGERRLVAVHLISSLVYLPPNHAMELQKQVQSNRVNYNIRGTFRVRVHLGLIHFSYWLHGRCQLEMSSPPTGVLIARSCRTKR